MLDRKSSVKTELFLYLLNSNFYHCFDKDRSFMATLNKIIYKQLINDKNKTAILNNSHQVAYLKVMIFKAFLNKY
ncbi:hypothetical protein [Shewanella sp.]|uniref:hypothetical protein n=1 Tax=Shewanella sp. TaxID=50422 RepID=UPI004048E8B3